MNSGLPARFGLVAAGALSTVLLAACGGGGSDASSESSGETAEGFPVTVETIFGDVEIEDRPENVVALGWSDAEAALALGVQPVGVADWQGYGGAGVGPWAADLFDSEPVLLDTMEPNVEAIASLEPDVLLDTRSDNSDERHGLLEPIAPVVGPPPGVEVTYGTTWQQQTRQVAQVVGEQERGEELVTELEDRFAQLREENPEFADLTIAVGAYFDGQYGAYVPGDTRADVLTDLGFEYKPELVEMADGAFYADLSAERVEELDADLIIVFPIGDVVETLNEDPVLQGIGSAEAGRLIVLDDPELANAFSSGSTLGIHHALDEIVPLLQETLED
ncbi:iron-siderophore ABC transporter substrate-binding protein [Nocardiopsis ganjiahuensis]|uniref:iron-siderophore ABC transporter substrate-binding protein n=1 Tax=Nocardiopsis ganjiahuensis TaxID=239984 RepID=UPI000348C2C6|nr:iron-siderophore ABC transporter substrate-binding protein [Nocardiopsis ganjiahuensis]